MAPYVHSVARKRSSELSPFLPQSSPSLLLLPELRKETVADAAIDGGGRVWGHEQLLTMCYVVPMTSNFYRTE